MEAIYLLRRLMEDQRETEIDLNKFTKSLWVFLAMQCGGF